VQNHVSNIYGKLGVASRTEAALVAIRRGLVQIGGDVKREA
jgi:DNA-binding NarL/FixJ family response regulator